MVYLRFGYSPLLFLVRRTQFIPREIFIGMNLNKQTDTRTHARSSVSIGMQQQFLFAFNVSTSAALGVYFGSMLCARAPHTDFSSKKQKQKKEKRF